MSLFRLSVQVLLLGTLLACAPTAEETARTENTEPEALTASTHQIFRPPPERFRKTQLSSAGRFQVSYTAEPDPIPLNQHFRIILNVQDAQSRQPAPENIQLSLDATMPAHNHGMNVKPVLEALAPGRYEVQGLLFHMAGYWEIAVQLQAPDAETETVLFGVNAEIKPTATEAP